MNEKILVAYYSYSGNTRALAEAIADKTQGDLFEIVPEKPYSAEYQVVVDQVQKELEYGTRPALKNKLDHIDSYDFVFVGTPNWWSTIAPPVQTFLEMCDFSSKVLIPFCTHGGGGSGFIEKNAKRLSKKADVRDIFSCIGKSFSAADVEVWLQKQVKKR